MLAQYNRRLPPSIGQSRTNVEPELGRATSHMEMEQIPFIYLFFKTFASSRPVVCKQFK